MPCLTTRGRSGLSALLYISMVSFMGTVILLLAEGVVEGEGVILDVFGDSVHFVLRFMDFDLRVCAGDGVYFSALFLFFEDGSLSYADGQLHGGVHTLRSLLVVWGESSFSLNLLFSIMISKSMSTFLPLCRL